MILILCYLSNICKFLRKINFKNIRSQGYSFQIEMNFKAWVLKAKIKDKKTFKTIKKRRRKKKSRKTRSLKNID